MNTVCIFILLSDLNFLCIQVEEDTGGTPSLPSKQKDTVKEEAAASSPSKLTPSGSAKGTPSTAKTAKGKRKNGEDVKPSSAPPKKMKTETVCTASSWFKLRKSTFICIRRICG